MQLTAKYRFSGRNESKEAIMRTASEADAMLELKRRGWSTRQIAAELGAERKTCTKIPSRG